MEELFHTADVFVIELIALLLLVITGYQIIKHKLKP